MLRRADDWVAWGTSNSVSCSLASATRASISASNCLSGGIKVLALGIAYNNKNMRPVKIMYVKIFQNWNINEKLVQRRHRSTSNYLFSFLDTQVSLAPTHVSKLVGWLVRWSVRWLVTLSDFQSLVSNGRTNQKVKKTKSIYFRILLLEGTSPPTKMYMKA